LRHSAVIRPGYAAAFRCIGPACEDTCCAGWRVDIDRATYDKYQSVPPGPLRILIDEHVERAPARGGETPPSLFATVRLPASLHCPFHNPDRLCQIQVEHGPDYLSEVCRTYPRNLLTIDRLEDRTLSLSCPEAARLVLLHPNLMARNSEPARTCAWDDRMGDGQTTDLQPLRSYFWPLREFIVALVLNRAYPLWQRLFLLGAFCRRLQARESGELKRAFPALLKDFSAAVASGGLSAGIESIPADLPLQLSLLAELVKLGAAGNRVNPRLLECLSTFAEGVHLCQTQPGVEQIALYQAAYSRFYQPFFQRHPAILENLLLNRLFLSLFPLGRSMLDPGLEPEPEKEFLKLAIEFALVKGVLIGVAARHREEFSIPHVVHTVQVLSKYFEHNQDFLARAPQLLAGRKLDNAHGVTMLLKN